MGELFVYRGNDCFNARNCWERYDRIIILQELEYFIKSNIEIENFFINNRTEYILAQNISNATNLKEILY